MKRNIITIAIAALVVLSGALIWIWQHNSHSDNGAPAADTTENAIFPYQDKSLPAEQRAADLLARLDLQEKAELTMNASVSIERLGIKQYNWWNEALHGVGRNGSATVFPMPIGMAASFDTQKIEEVFTAVSDEARIKHAQEAKEGKSGHYKGLTFWTPNINIFRDPRWGRGMETYGEDPYLTGQVGMAVVSGLQGDPDAEILKLHACAKHFAVHSGLESNRHRFNAEVSERDLRETYLPAFKDLVTKAGVKEVMTAYNRFRGDPCAASEYLVKDILRGEWGYQGMIVSDCSAINDFYHKGRHEYVDNAVMAAAAAVRNGVDVECGSTYVNIPEAVQSGLLDEKDLDRNVLRLLTERFRLGEMDGWSPWDDLDPALVEGPEHRALSLDIAHETMVLLKNNGVLPLDKDSRIAVVGPNADDEEMLWGNYNPIPKSTITLLEAMRDRFPDLTYVRGCGVLDADMMPENYAQYSQMLEMTDEQREEYAKANSIDKDVFKKSIRKVQQMVLTYHPALDEADVLGQLDGIDLVIFAGGISPRLEGESMPVNVKGFSGGDRTDIEIPDVQRRLVKALHDAGKKVVFVNFSGCAMGLVPEAENCDAILQAWYPGQEGGTAIADVLLGEVNPSGKLPLTFYKDVSQLPDVEDYDMEGHTYRFFRGEPLYPFGYGLSYTTFSYDNPKLKKNRLTVSLTNTGKMDGTEVVQLYIRKTDDPDGPAKTLRGFQRVAIKAGKTAKVTFRLDDETFLWWSESEQDMVPLDGEYELMVGGSSDSKDLKTVTYIKR